MKYRDIFYSGHVSVVLHHFANLCSPSSLRFIVLHQVSAPQIKRSENKNNSKKKEKLCPQLGVETHLQTMSMKIQKRAKNLSSLFFTEDMYLSHNSGG